MDGNLPQNTKNLNSLFQLSSNLTQQGQNDIISTFGSVDIFHQNYEKFFIFTYLKSLL